MASLRLLLFVMMLLHISMSSPLYDSYEYDSKEKIFSDKQINEIKSVLDSAAQGELAHNLTVIELALQNFLIERTTDSAEVTLDGKPIPKSELKELHTSLEKVGQLLRDSLDLSPESRKRKAGGLGGRFESGEHERIAERNALARQNNPPPLSITAHAPSPAPQRLLLLPLLITLLLPLHR